MGSSSSSSRDHSGHIYPNIVEDNKISKYNKALNESPAMSQIEKINRERDSRTSTPSSSGKKHGNGVVSRSANSGDNSRNIESKYTKVLEDNSESKSKRSTTNDDKLADQKSDVLQSSRKPSAFNNSNKTENDSKSSR